MSKRKRATATPDVEHTPHRNPAGAPALRRCPEPDARVLLHELRVHQVELEIQNEELRTARAEMESALERYTELFEFAPIGYATIGADRSIEDLNHAGTQLLGKERSGFRGPFEQLVAPAHHEAFIALLRSAEASAMRQTCEVELRCADGRACAVRLSAIALRRAEPKILLAFEDISDAKQRQQKLEQTERALREADRRKDEFLAVLSHELRNPLAPIRTSVFVLARSTPDSDAARRAQLIIDRQVTHLTRLIDDLLDVTRIARGKVQLQLEQVEISALLRRALDDHRNSFDAMGIELDLVLNASTARVHADPARLVQIVSNVLTNALKFTPRGGRVVVSLRREQGKVVLGVSDNGVGIPAEVLEHVFEPFAQAPQTLDRARGGLGLGLAMVKGLVELHGGNVQIESAGLGAGTEVLISLPLYDAELMQRVEAPAAPHRSRRVLVIEDNLDASDTLQVALTLNGHHVRIAHDGPRGLEVAAEFEPDVVICDIGLPGMDGYAVARAFRTHQALHDTFLVALSGYAQPEDLQRAREAGFNHHVAKPTSLEALENLLAEAPREAGPVAQLPS